jgi:hypothetical protein
MNAEAAPRCPLPLILKLVFVLVALLFLLIVALAVWRVGLASGNGQRLKAIAASGEPATARELDAWYEAVDEKENAALVWLEGIEKLEKGEGTPWTRMKLPPRGQPFGQAQLQMASEALAANTESLAIFRRAAKMPKSRYPVDFSQGVFAALDHLSQLKSATTLLQLEAVVHAQNGRGTEAAASIHAMLGAGRSLAQEPLFISQLVRAALDYQAGSTTERVLNLTALTEPQLAALQTALVAAETPNLSTRALIGERACTATVMHSPRDLTPPSNPAALENSVATQKGFGSSLMRVSGFFQRDLGYFLDAMATNIAATRLPDPELFHSRTNTDAIAIRARRGYYIMSGLTLPALARATDRDVAHRARLRTVQTALAIERHRLANGGKLPASLEVLVPKYLAAVPVDPFTGDPLIFKNRPRGYVVYSLGEDTNDDDGTPLPSGSTASRTPHDIPFVMER